MANKIIVSGIVAGVVGVVAAVGVKVFDQKDLTEGPANNDKCVSKISYLELDKKIDCVVKSVHVSKARPANGWKDDEEMSKAWECNGRPADHACLADIMGSKKEGDQIHFTGKKNASGDLEWTAETVKAP